MPSPSPGRTTPGAVQGRTVTALAVGVLWFGFVLTRSTASTIFAVSIAAVAVIASLLLLLPTPAGISPHVAAVRQAAQRSPGTVGGLALLTLLAVGFGVRARASSHCERAPAREGEASRQEAPPAGPGAFTSPDHTDSQMRSTGAATIEPQPASPLDLARTALADGYDPTNDRGGRLGDAERVLGAIQAGSPEYAAAQQLLQEVARRRQREQVLSNEAVRHPGWGGLGRVSARRVAEEIYQGFLARGLHVASVTAPLVLTGLVIDYAECDRSFLVREFGTLDAQRPLRQAGIESVACRTFYEGRRDRHAFIDVRNDDDNSLRCQ